MDYQFEQLGQDRFQQFCQALLATIYPNVTCFPVAQPDGGRDALVYINEHSKDSFLVFQVKFVKKPYAESDPHKWLLDIIAKELPKIKGLIPKGANQYFLLTNIPGTAHLDVGGIDIMKNLLEEMPIPSECWWRDDISRRLEGKPDLRWAYPELISGMDILKQLIEVGLSESRERRSATVRAFLRDQYENEKQVRFKQVELLNKLLELYIDVPLVIRENGGKSKYFLQTLYRLAGQYEEDEGFTPRMAYDEGGNIGAASFFLLPITQKYFPEVVLEGAPGQGKSTITQYVCQVHRIRLLNEEHDLSLLNEQHRLSPLRLPIRVDLRDFATWIGRKDPFSSNENAEAPFGWVKSLEAFLATLISHHSGGCEFSVSDLMAIFKTGSILLVFDGLDEIADMARRQDVVDEITKGVKRLKENTKFLQIIITSRPAAFTNSPGFSGKSYHYCHLDSLSPSLINEYTEKWIRARKLQSRESADIRKTLREKLDQPHLRDLARNPMQLAILLSLIHNRGESLPDKRTELYDCYVELFFSRESQKSSVVREHRNLLINIHRYLAWILHSEVEVDDNRHNISRGSISAQRLEKLVNEYLSHEGYDPELTKILFTGMVERVVALVSRVEGTYEFEVQPLREYFAARYLYETAPYSPPGSPRGGNILERFDAIARNFYWLNVARFYSGCFSIGELPSLADSLEDLANDKGYSQTNHPRFLAATLLADWVFSQHPKSMKQVVSIVLDGLGLRLTLTSSNKRSRSGIPFILPKQCGGSELVSQGFAILSKNPARDFALDVIELVKLNATSQEILSKWLDQITCLDGGEKTKWLEYGLLLGALPQAPIQDIEAIIRDDPNQTERLILLYRARLFNLLEYNDNRFQKIIQLILNKSFNTSGARKTEFILEELSHVFDPSRYALAFMVRQPIPLQKVWENSGRYTDFTLDMQKYSSDNRVSLENCKIIIATAIRESQKSALEWACDLTPWDNLIETSRSIYGEQWCNFLLSNIASAIKSTKETCIEFDELFDNEKSLCRRVRYARLRAGNSKWWDRQLTLAKTHQEIAFASLILITWGSRYTIEELAYKIGEAIQTLPFDLWKTLIQSIKLSINLVSQTNIESKKGPMVSVLPNNLTLRGAVAIATSSKLEDAQSIYTKYLRDYNGDDPIIWAFCQDMAVVLLRNDPDQWVNCLAIIQKSYALGCYGNYYAYEYRRQKEGIPLAAAQLITKNPEKFPSFLVALAETVCKNDVSKGIVPVGIIAERDKWFV
jgi:hypothetical protein